MKKRGVPVLDAFPEDQKESPAGLRSNADFPCTLVKSLESSELVLSVRAVVSICLVGLLLQHHRAGAQ